MKRIRFNAENRALAWQAPSGTANIVQEGLGDGRSLLTEIGRAHV